MPQPLKTEEAGRSRHWCTKTKGALVRNGFQTSGKQPEHSDPVQIDDGSPLRKVVIKLAHHEMKLTCSTEPLTCSSQE